MSSPPEDRNVLVADRWWSKLPRSVYKNMKRVPVTSEWFEVYLVGRDTFVIYEPGQYEEAISTLVIGSARAALIDTGCGISNIADVVDEITDLPVFVFNTHSHNDHVADNHRFKEIWMLDHPWSVEAQKGGRMLEVIHTPGHTPDSCCFLDRDHRLLFTGDMFYTGGIYTYLNGGDIPTFIKSYRKMLTHYDEFNRLMPSHNEPFVEKELLKEALTAVEGVAAGKGKYVEGEDVGIPIRKYDFGRFSIVTRAG